MLSASNVFASMELGLGLASRPPSYDNFVVPWHQSKIGPGGSDVSKYNHAAPIELERFID